ncbi:SEL1-like repeat protein [Bacteroides sp. Marseille-P3684]|uniref:SEL1-like repeat protein n=1 Tax=Bacteroides sp. Marseille-P3684 TaxID=2086579 RepID=UPI00130082CA|nr:SEL1-like repeat protein [Bacteroides sp. Marseille-P3684]
MNLAPFYFYILTDYGSVCFWLSLGSVCFPEKAFHYYEEAEDYYNMGRMYEQGVGTKQDLQKAFECYSSL